MKTDPRIDDYIAKAAPFARPILTRLREIVHAALPQAEETIKWSVPHFTVAGKNVAGMAAFKAHCSFAIHGEGRQGGDAGMGQYGKMASLAEIPSESELARAPEGCRSAHRDVRQRHDQAGEGCTESSDRDARRLRRGPTRPGGGAGYVRRFHSVTAARISRMDHPGQARGDAIDAHRSIRGMAGRGQETELEVREVLNSPSELRPGSADDRAVGHPSRGR